MRHALVVATGNRAKLQELKALLVDLPLEVLSVDEALTRTPTIIEDGSTFADNASKKARAIARATMMLTLGDDSGLEVDALGGAPGVRSARYAHPRATDAENNAALLSALAGASGDGDLAPRARFRCVLALVDPLVSMEPHLVEGSCEGRILMTPRGSGGFGYDPLFLVDGHDKTMAELDEATKSAISHRGRAFQALRLVLEKILLARDESARRISGA